MTAKDSLKVAFLELLKELPLNHISVIHLCEKANVNRQTFYYYYQDVIDILKDVLFEEIDDEISKGSAYDNWKHGFLTTTSFIKDNYKTFVNIFHSTYWEEVNRYFTEASNTLLLGVINECITKTNVNVTDEDKTFMVLFYRVAFNGIMTEWVENGMQIEPEALLFKLEKMVDGTIYTALRRFEKN